MAEGLFNKYKIEKTDGSPIDPHAKYFVLRIDTDKDARFALMQYAYKIRKDSPEFSMDLVNWIFLNTPENERDEFQPILSAWQRSQKE